MSFHLKRINHPGAANYVAPAGSPKAYVTKRKARVYASRKEAEADRCPENEVIVHANETP